MRGLGVADRRAVETAIHAARELSMQINAWESRWPINTYRARDASKLSNSMLDRGVAVIYISHRLEEIGTLADTVTVLRDGRHIETRPAAELTHAEIIRLMVGRSLDALFPKEEAQIGDVVFKANGLSRRGIFSDVSFELRRGEIVGLAGFVGAGGPRSLAQSSASTRSTRGGSGSKTVRSGRGRRAPRCGAGWHICPKTASTRGSSSRCRSRRTRPSLCSRS